MFDTLKKKIIAVSAAILIAAGFYAANKPGEEVEPLPQNDRQNSAPVESNIELIDIKAINIAKITYMEGVNRQKVVEFVQAMLAPSQEVVESKNDVYESQLSSEDEPKSSNIYLREDGSEVNPDKPNYFGYDFRQGADIQGMNFKNADLRKSNLDNQNFSGKDLSGTKLVETSAKNVDFRNTNLENAIIIGVDLDGADLRGANLKGVHINDAVFKNIKIDAAAILSLGDRGEQKYLIKKIMESNPLVTILYNKKSYLKARFSDEYMEYLDDLRAVIDEVETQYEKPATHTDRLKAQSSKATSEQARL